MLATFWMAPGVPTNTLEKRSTQRGAKVPEKEEASYHPKPGRPCGLLERDIRFLKTLAV